MKRPENKVCAVSDAVENLTKACIQLEEGRRELIQKQAMVQEAAISRLVSDPEHKHGVAENIFILHWQTISSDEVPGYCIVAEYYSM